MVPAPFRETHSAIAASERTRDVRSPHRGSGVSKRSEAGNDPPEASHSQTAGVVFAAVAAVAFGTLAIFAKFGYEEGAHPLPLLATRFSLATLVLAGFSLATRRSLKLPRASLLRLIALGGLG